MLHLVCPVQNISIVTDKLGVGIENPGDPIYVLNEGSEWPIVTLHQSGTDPYPVLRFVKTYGDYISSTTIADGAFAGAVTWSSTRDNALRTGARIEARAVGDWGPANQGMRLFFKTNDPGYNSSH